MSKFVIHYINKMENLPTDPYILLSFVNTKLRDDYTSLEQMCDDLDIDQIQLTRKLNEAGFEYSQDNNKFI